MDLEDILNEISQTQKEKYYMVPLIRGTQNRRIHGDTSRIEVTSG